MKRTYKYALSAVLSASLVVPAVAQTGFPDVKDTHWAADSVNRLKLSGLVHGFKDGEYKGDRTMTRYEMASAVYAIYAKLVCFNEEIDKKIKALEAKINSIKPNEPAPAPDLSDIKTALADMRNEFGSMKAWGSDLAQLKRMSSAYSTELKSLGVDIKEMQKNISDVSARVAKLENPKGGMTITGDETFWMAGAATANGAGGVLNQDGRFLLSHPTGAGFDSLTTLHEFGLKVEDKKAPIPYKAEIVAGNTLNNGGGFSNQVYNPINLGTPITSGMDTIYLQDLQATYRPWDLTVGRQGLKLNKYIFKRPDTTAFFSSERWDDGNWRFDGGILGFNHGAGKVFMGQISNATTAQGTQIQPVVVGALSVQRAMGATYDFKIGEKAKVVASYVNFDGGLGVNFSFVGQPSGRGGPPSSGVTRQTVYGADLNYDLGALKLELGGGKSTAYGIAQTTTSTNGKTGSDTQNLDTLINTANSRWDAAVNFHGLRLGYRNVEINYLAPGDWGRIAVFRNLTDTKAYNASGSVAVGKIGVHGWYEKGEAIAGIGNYSSWRAGAETDLTPKWEADLTFESTDFKGGFQGTVNGASCRFRTLRLGYDVGANRMFDVFWQHSDLDKFNISRGRASIQQGDFFGFQYSIKF